MRLQKIPSRVSTVQLLSGIGDSEPLKAAMAGRSMLKKLDGKWKIRRSQFTKVLIYLGFLAKIVLTSIHPTKNKSRLSVTFWRKPYWHNRHRISVKRLVPTEPATSTRNTTSSRTLCRVPTGTSARRGFYIVVGCRSWTWSVIENLEVGVPFFMGQ